LKNKAALSFPREDAASGPPEDVMGQQESQEEYLLYSENGNGLYARAVRESGGLYMREGGGGGSGLYREDLGYERELGSSLYSRQEFRAETKMPFLHCRNYSKTLSSFAKVTFI
jgi:hypothetical protein